MLSKLKAAFKARPLLSNCIIYGTLYGGAELSQQIILRKVTPEKPQDFDLPLVSRYFILGSTAFPVFLYYWYKFLDPRMPGTDPRTIVAKVIIDQLVTAPPILATFFVGMSIMEGKEDIFAELKQKFFSSFKSSCGFWIPAQAINFAFLPTQARVAYLGTCSFLWIQILCILKRSTTLGLDEEADVEKEL